MLDKILRFIIQRLGVDWITEQGYKDGWYYEKWNSGKCECWKHYVGTGINAAENNYSGFYYSAGIDAILPFKFTKIYDFQINGGSFDRVNFVNHFGAWADWDSERSGVRFILLGHEKPSTAN